MLTNFGGFGSKLLDPAELDKKLSGADRKSVKPLNTKEKTEGKTRYELLQSQYDKKTKTYTIDGKKVKSKFTPSQGGYFTDKTLGKDKFGDDIDNTLYDRRASFGITEYSKSFQKSARKPFKRVNRSLIKSRQSNRKQRALAYGRSGTVLTNTLGGGVEDKRKKKTLLG